MKRALLIKSGLFLMMTAIVVSLHVYCSQYYVIKPDSNGLLLNEDPKDQKIPVNTPLTKEHYYDLVENGYSKSLIVMHAQRKTLPFHDLFKVAMSSIFLLGAGISIWQIRFEK